MFNAIKIRKNIYDEQHFNNNLIMIKFKPKLHLVFHFQSIYHTTRQPAILQYFLISSHLKYNLTFIFNLIAIL